jgi:hypothetical protein
MYQAPNAPLSIGGVLDSGFRLFRECFTQVFLFAVATSLVAAPASFVTPYVAANGPTPAFITSVAGGFFVITLIAMIFTTAMLARIDAIARGEQLSFGNALGIGVRRLPAVIGSYLLVTLAVGALPCAVLIAFVAAGMTTATTLAVAGLIAFCLFIVPGSIIAVWLLFGPYAAMIDRLGPLTSLRYSRAITRGYWWRTTGLVTIIGVIMIVIYVVLGLAAGIAAIANPGVLESGQPPWYFQFVIGPLLQAVALPLAYSLILAIYYDLKLRHEGGDLAARIAGAA